MKVKTETAAPKEAAASKETAAVNERVINGVRIDDNSPMYYVANPKRPNAAAGKRYEIYMKAKTVKEYFEMFLTNESLDKKFALPDLRHDQSKNFVSFEAPETEA